MGNRRRVLWNVASDRGAARMPNRCRTLRLRSCAQIRAAVDGSGSRFAKVASKSSFRLVASFCRRGRSRPFSDAQGRRPSVRCWPEAAGPLPGTRSGKLTHHRSGSSAATTHNAQSPVMDSFCADPCAGGHWGRSHCALLQGLQELRQVIRRLIPAHFRVWFLDPSQGLFLHCQVGLDVSVCRGRSLVAEPERATPSDSAEIMSSSTVAYLAKTQQSRRCTRPKSTNCP